MFTSHWRNRDLAGVDAVMVAISRGKPRWTLDFRYRVLSELAPSNEAWAMKDRESFEAAYGRQLEELGAEWILERLAAIGDGRPCVLLCWERLADPGEWCHRRLLADWLHTQTEIVVPELEPGMIRKRPDAPQPALFDYGEERA
ncbi:hypothetical protein AVDCRST_MAG82-2099 [uncultured Rubrobacteraceae bacterium]|uniref:DUF488 domain-containing protein n=1 Tax=uncultured Rubrobacteraceae bacterium TaxID=349277 RepID=A0A6J4Q531_9ACTN|nr:hypothetical protein AVDCRST_MAG82-2099 [uncultured Rubrobacteraceae bacterium]